MDPGHLEPGGRDAGIRLGRSQVGVSGVPIIKLPEGGPHTGNSLMRDAGVDQEVHMRKVGHAGKDINDRYTHVLIEAHLAPPSRRQRWSGEAGKATP